MGTGRRALPSHVKRVRGIRNKVPEDWDQPVPIRYGMSTTFSHKKSLDVKRHAFISNHNTI